MDSGGLLVVGLFVIVICFIVADLRKHSSGEGPADSDKKPAVGGLLKKAVGTVAGPVVGPLGGPVVRVQHQPHATISRTHKSDPSEIRLDLEPVPAPQGSKLRG